MNGHFTACCITPLFGRRDGENVGLSADDLRELRTVDTAELERAAKLVVRGVIERKHRGLGTLADLYPRSFSAIHAESAVAAFLESPEGQAWGVTTRIEDAFGRFLAGYPGVDPDVAADERCTAVARGLLIEPPEYELPEGFFACATGWYTIRPGPVLVAAVRGTLVQGPISEAICSWIRAGDAPAGPPRDRPATAGVAVGGTVPRVLAFPRRFHGQAHGRYRK